MTLSCMVDKSNSGRLRWLVWYKASTISLAAFIVSSSEPDRPSSLMHRRFSDARCSGWPARNHGSDASALKSAGHSFPVRFAASVSLSSGTRLQPQSRPRRTYGLRSTLSAVTLYELAQIIRLLGVSGYILTTVDEPCCSLALVAAHSDAVWRTLLALVGAAKQA